jgi:DNA-directed DNA polymerase III PolC
MSFVHLHVHSNFSMLAGTRRVEDLVEAASRAGCPAVALTDTNGLYAVVPFQHACERRGVQPIYGAETVAPWELSEDESGPLHSRGAGAVSTGPHNDPDARAVLLARNRPGYAEISRLLTSLHLDEHFALGKALRNISDDLYVISSDERVLSALAGRAYIRAALPTAPGPEWKRRRWRIARLAERLGVRTVAAQEIYFIEPDEHFLHRVLTAIRTRSTVGMLPEGAAAPPGAYLRSPTEIERVFADDRAPLEETLRIAEDCSFELDLRSPKLPRFQGPKGEDPARMLRRLAMKGLRRRMESADADPQPADEYFVPDPDQCPDGADPTEWKEALGTLDYELGVVESKGLAEYFLICWDIVRFARGRGMRSLGRGSAGNSILSYALGITHFNPLKHNMFFERFLNPERKQLPDFDIDFGTDDREEVLRYIFRRYGRDCVAMIGTYSTFRARAALRETAKALGIPEGEVGPFIKRLPYFASIERLEEICRISPAASDIPLAKEPFKTLLPLAVKIGGFPRHMATHPCGLVVSPEPITGIVPLQRGDRGLEITQWSMYEVEGAGLVKIDIIGQKGLAVIEEAAEMAEENEGRPLHPERIDALNDERAKRLLREGRTEGCFYIESPVMIQLMQQARCDDFEVLTALSSIIRPGVSNHGGKRSYLRRHLGLEPVEAIHPVIQEVLKDTYGCLIYQEQVIRIAVAVAGMSYAEADGLRRCMSFKNKNRESMATYRDSFMNGALKRGIPEDTACEIFRRIASFAGYAFCKAHSASFALESFESAYWKAHYPAEFMAAVLSNGGGYYSQEEYLEEARRLGLEILPPCVNRSRLRHHGRGRELRIGLYQVKTLTKETAEAIVKERPFHSLSEFLERTHASANETENLIRCGAMKGFGRTRPELLWELKALRGGEGGASHASAESGAPHTGDAHDPAAVIRQIPRLPDYGRAKSVALERETLDLAVTAHPLAMFDEEITRATAGKRITRSVDLARRTGQRVELLGWRVTVKGTRTMDRGEEMIFATFSDRFGRYEAIFFPDTYRRTARTLFRAKGPFLITGRVESDLGAVKLSAEKVLFIGG